MELEEAIRLYEANKDSELTIHGKFHNLYVANNDSDLTIHDKFHILYKAKKDSKLTIFVISLTIRMKLPLTRIQR